MTDIKIKADKVVSAYYDDQALRTGTGTLQISLRMPYNNHITNHHYEKTQIQKTE